MAKYNPNIHHRNSIRLKGYDYSQAGLYFVTICTQNRACLFGNISDGKMILIDAGKMVEKWYNELENKFSDIQCREMITMPNHFHTIIENVEADRRVCLNDKLTGEHDLSGFSNCVETFSNPLEHKPRRQKTTTYSFSCRPKYFSRPSI